MRAINHALTGAVIGFVVHEPFVAVPVAVASHYVCDVIPHYGAGLSGNQELKTPLFRKLLYVDAVLCAVLVAVLTIQRPSYWLLAVICAFAAAAPDLLSLKRYRRVIGNRSWRAGIYSKFAHAIQWFERPIGAVVEAAWFTAALIILIPFLR